VKPLDKPNGGIANARNFGIQHSIGQYIAFCDQDDFWLPNKLSEQVPLFKNEKVGLVYSFAMKQYTFSTEQTIVIKKDNGRGKVFSSLITENLVPTCTVIVKKEIFEEIGFFNEKKSLMGVDDWDLWLRFSLVTEFDFVEKPLAIHVFHGNNYSSNNAVMHKAELICLEELKLFINSREINMVEDWKLIERNVHLKYSKDYIHDGLFDLAKKALSDANKIAFDTSCFFKLLILAVTPKPVLNRLQNLKRNMSGAHCKDNT